MFYRVQIDIGFTDEQDAVDFLNMVEDYKTKTKQTGGLPGTTVERTSRYHKCYHDETPPQPCGDYVYVDFSKPKKNHSKKDI